MLKLQARITAKVDDKECHFYLDNDCPIQTAKEMVFQFQKYLGQVEDQYKVQLEALKAQDKENEKKVDITPEEPSVEAM